MHRRAFIAGAANAVAAAAASQPFPQPFPWSRRGAILDRAVPAVGSTGNRPPREIRLMFDRGVIAPLSRVRVESPSGAAIGAGRPVDDPADPQVLVVRLRRPLGPGTYFVRWYAISVDRHQATGSYHFAVS
jgi:copper transport protein